MGTDKINFIFTGLGPHVEILEKEKIENVILTGPKSGTDLSEIYASADAFVFPSSTETFGNVLLEAMASGLPTLSVDSGGVTDFAIPGVNSLVCKHHDPQSIADGIIQLAQNPLLRQHLAQNALETAKERSWTNIFNQLINDYKAVLSKRFAIAG